MVGEANAVSEELDKKMYVYLFCVPSYLKGKSFHEIKNFTEFNVTIHNFKNANFESFEGFCVIWYCDLYPKLHLKLWHFGQWQLYTAGYC